MTTCSNNDTALDCATTKAFTKPRDQASNDDQDYSVRVYVPGVDKSGVTLSLAKEILTITAKRSDSVPESWKALGQELPSEDYQLLLQLDGKIDPDRITAKLENGVLDVTLPVKEAVKPRVIEVA
ncbi:MAG: HSP20 family protein [Verrucomicrobiales bacterium]|jgi:HSP20 family protein